MISQGLDVLLTEGVDPTCAETASEAIRAMESASRRMAAAQISLLRSVRSRNLHHHDGHTSAKVMVRHEADLSGGEAAAREKSVVMLTPLDEVEAAPVAGELGLDQVRLLSRVYANRRVRSAMAGAQDWFLEMAEEYDYPNFATVVRQWERLLDDDGPDPASIRSRLVQPRARSDLSRLAPHWLAELGGRRPGETGLRPLPRRRSARRLGEGSRRTRRRRLHRRHGPHRGAASCRGVLPGVPRCGRQPGQLLSGRLRHRHRDQPAHIRVGALPP